MESEWPSKVSQCKQEMGDVLDAAVMGLHSRMDQVQGAIPDNLDTTIAGTCKELMEKQEELLVDIVSRLHGHVLNLDKKMVSMLQESMPEAIAEC